MRERIRRRDRRRRQLWVVVVMLALAAAVIAAWPGNPAYSATGTVSVGRPGASVPRPATSFEARDTAAPETLTRIVSALQSKQPVVAITVIANGRSGERAFTALSRALDAVRALAPVRPGAHAVTVTTPVINKTHGPQTFGRDGIAAILLVLAIAGADVLFLTRTKLKSPHADETTRARHARHKVQRQRQRARTGRAPAAPLDLPNLQVHFVDLEAGRAVSLRDAPPAELSRESQ